MTTDRESAREALITFAETAGILWPSDQPIVSVKPVARGYGGLPPELTTRTTFPRPAAYELPPGQLT